MIEDLRKSLAMFRTAYGMAASTMVSDNARISSAAHDHLRDVLGIFETNIQALERAIVIAQEMPV